MSACADRSVGECSNEWEACAESWDGATDEALSESTAELMGQCFPDNPSAGRRRRLSSGSRPPAICSGHGACQGVYDCQYDAMVRCMEATGVPDETLDASKSLYTCYSSAAGCEDPARVRSGGVSSARQHRPVLPVSHRPVLPVSMALHENQVDDDDEWMVAFEADLVAALNHPTQGLRGLPPLPHSSLVVEANDVAVGRRV